MQKTARLLTEVFSPVITATVFFILIGVANGAWLTGILTTLVAVGIPAAVLIFANRRGWVSDWHIRDRRQRWPFLLLALVTIGLAIALAICLGAPRQLTVSMIFTVFGVVLVGVVNLAWKLSVHAAMTSFLAVAVTATIWPWGLIGWLILIAVCWSRVRLKDHTVAQVISGAAAGAAIGVGYLMVLA